MSKKMNIIASLFFIGAIIVYVQLTLALLEGITPLIFTYLYFLLLFYKSFQINEYVKVRYSKLSVLFRSYLFKALIYTMLFCIIMGIIYATLLFMFSIPFQLLQITNYFIFLFINCFVLLYAIIIDQLYGKKKIIPIIVFAMGLCFSLMPFPLSLFSFMTYPLSTGIKSNMIPVIGVYLLIWYLLYMLKEVKKC